MTKKVQRYATKTHRKAVVCCYVCRQRRSEIKDLVCCVTTIRNGSNVTNLKWPHRYGTFYVKTEETGTDPV